MVAFEVAMMAPSEVAAADCLRFGFPLRTSERQEMLAEAQSSTGLKYRTVVLRRIEVGQMTEL